MPLQVDEGAWSACSQAYMLSRMIEDTPVELVPTLAVIPILAQPHRLDLLQIASAATVAILAQHLSC